MADKESRLNLRLTAQNEATPAFTQVAEAMRSITGPSEDAAKAVSSFMSEFRSAMESLGMGATTIEGVGKSFTSVSEASAGLSKVFADDQKIIGEMTTTLQGFDRALSETAQSMRNVGGASEAFAMAKTNASTLEESISKGGLLIGAQLLGQALEGLGEKGAHAFESAIHSAADFEASISRIHAVLMNREPTANMEEMSQTALRLGSNSKFSANEIAQGIYELARQGLSSAQILGDGVNGAIEVVNNLAQSTDTGMSETAKVITDVMHEFNLSGEQLSKVGDMISGTMHTSSISMNDFYYSMRQVGSVSSNVHQSIEDVSTTIALLAQHGISGSSAGTALKNMLLGLEPRTKKAAELMAELGISAKDGAANSFYQLNGNLKPLPDIIGILNDKYAGLNDRQKEAALSATFTKYGLAGLNTIVMEGKDKFEELKKTLMDEKSADIAREKLNNLQGDMLRFNAAAETMKKSFGDTLAPAMRSVAQAAQGVVQWFTNLSPSTKETIMVVGGVASAMFLAGGVILNVVSAIGFLSMGLSGLGLTFGAILGPIGLVIAAVAAIGFGVYELITHFDQVKSALRPLGDVFSQVWGVIKQVTQDAWNYIGPTIHDGLTEISSFWNTVWPQMKQVFEEVWTVIKVFATPILEFLKVEFDVTLGILKGAWDGAWGMIKDVFKTAWDFIVDSIRLGWDLISGAFKIALDLLTGNWSKAWTDFLSVITNFRDDFNKTLGDLVVNAFDFGKNLLKMLAGGIMGGIEEVGKAVSEVADKIKSFLGFHSPTKEGPASDSDRWMPNLVNMLADGLKAGVPTIADAANTLISPIANSFTALTGGTKFDAEHMGSTIQLIINAKKEYADAAARHDQTAVDSAHKMADEYRANLESMGVNSKLFSQDVSVEDAMNNMQMIAKQSTTSAKNDHYSMTTGMMANNTALSSNTAMNTAGITKSWTDTRDVTVKVAMDLGNSLKSIFDFIKANAELMCSSIQTTFTNTFQAIAYSAESAANRIVSAMMSARAAMASASVASMGGDAIGQAAQSVPQFGEGGKVTKPTLAMVGEGGEAEYIIPESKLRGQTGYTMGLPQTMPFSNAGSGARSGPVINGGIHITVNGAGKDGKSLGSELMSMIRREFQFAL